MTSMLVLTLLIPEDDSLVTLGRNCFRRHGYISLRLLK